MTGLIDRQVANEYFDLYRHSVLSTDEITSMIPAAVASVVRCKDCLHHDGNKYCDLINQAGWYDEDFCSYGERKDG